MPWSAAYQPTYRQSMIDLVNTSIANGMTAIVDLQWACHDNPTWVQPAHDTYAQMAPDQHSIPFWQDVATVFKNNPLVMFELFNEPQLQIENTYGGQPGGSVWENGGVVTFGGDTWQAPGMQNLYDAVRSTGAANVVLADGLEWGSDLRMLTAGYSLDGFNIAYAYHGYVHDGQNTSRHTPYLDTKVWPSIDPNGRWAYAGMATEFGTAAKNLPLIPTATNYFKDTIAWFNSHGQSWAVWGWYPGNDPYALLVARPATPSSRGTYVLASF
jgi:hypothetical protein